MKATMHWLIVAALAGGAWTIGQASVGVQQAQEKERRVVARAHADIKGEGITGRAELVEYAPLADYGKLAPGAWTGGYVEVTLRVEGLGKPGLRGVHIHETGRCDPPDFKSAGGHFDPGPAGETDPDANHPHHHGDLPNLVVDGNGVGTLRALTSRITLSPSPVSVLRDGGTAIMVHANPDQGITGAPGSGVSGGPRAACGVIVRDEGK
jgi:Cu/Zn superoxide dismutase